MFDFNPIQIIASLPAIIIAMVFHEYAHARVADALGDPTARYMGRLTLNPVAHIDWIGLIMLILLRFGWAKPVMINPSNLENPRRDDIIISLAGPLVNLLIAFVGAGIYYFLMMNQISISSGLRMVLSYIILYNVNFAIFNMIPIPPLDGSHVIANLLPSKLAEYYESLARFGFIILIALLYTPILKTVLIPIQIFILSLFKIFFLSIFS